MKHHLLIGATVLCLTSGIAHAGCVSGAMKGGLIGHFAGHGMVGTAVGCAVGAHSEAVERRQAGQVPDHERQPYQQQAPGGSMVGNPFPPANR